MSEFGTTETRWWWVRHAPVDWAGKRIYGQSDVDCDCTDPGPFAYAAKVLPHDAILVRTPLTRTRQTAEAIAAAGAILPAAIVEPAFAEQHFGDWEGQQWEDIQERHREVVAKFWENPYRTAPPAGEFWTEMAARVRAGITRLSAEHHGRDIVCVAHGGPIRAALAMAMGLDEEPERAFAFRTDFCAITRIDHVGDRRDNRYALMHGHWRIVFVNKREVP